MDERLLIEQLKEGDEKAFKTVVDSWKDMVFNTILGIVQSVEDAEDLTQDVFIQVYNSISTFKGESKLSTWLYRIAITKSLDFERKKKRKKRFGFMKSILGDNNEEEVIIPDFHHPGIALDKKENASMLFEAIKELPENQKIAFVLNKVEGLSYQETSEIMQTTVPSVESLLHRAKTNLKKILAQKL